MDTTTTEPGIITQRLDAQGVLQPGEPGWWKVWGARAQHMRVGDMVMVKWQNEDESVDIREFEIAEIEPHAWLPRVTATDGERFRVGPLQPIVLLRQGTHNILA